MIIGPLVRDHPPASLGVPAVGAPRPPAPAVTRARVLATGVSLVLVTVVGTLASVALAYNHPDALAQQAMVHAFERYGFGPFAVGETNYILKMPLYWVVSRFDLAPHRELILDAALCNLAGLGLVFAAVQRAARRLVGLAPRRAWDTAWLVALVLAVNLPHVFLANYPNSRNVELGLGLLAAYRIVVCCRTRPHGGAAPTPAALAGTSTLVVVLSFADPLMLYALLLPVFLVAAGVALPGCREALRRSLRAGTAHPLRHHLRTRGLVAFPLLGAALLIGLLAQHVVAWLAPDAIHWARITPTGTRPTAAQSAGEIGRSLRYGLNVDFGRLPTRYGLRVNGYETDWVNLGLLAVAALSATRLGLRRLRYAAFAAGPVLLNLWELSLVDPDTANLSRYLIVTTTIVWISAVVAIVVAHPPPSRLVPAVLATVLAVAALTATMNLRTLAGSRWYRGDNDVTRTTAILEADGIDGVLSTWDRSIRLSWFSDGRILAGVADCSRGAVVPSATANLLADGQLRAAAERVDLLLIAPGGVDDPCAFVRSDGRSTLVVATPMGDVYRVPSLTSGLGRG